MGLSEESSAWVTLTRTPALDIRSLNRALEVFGTTQGFIQASDASREHAGIAAVAREFLTSPQAALSPAERAWLENPQHHVLPYIDPRYPGLLREAGRYPIALYVAGNAE